jgi:L,D-transpeptidase catalytic domain
MHQILARLIAFSLFTAIVVNSPLVVSEPGANPKDPAREDLTRVEYPSLAEVEWTPRFILPHETLESIYGDDWVTVARFNRVDRRHVYPGMTIKEPVDMEAAKNYTPMPPEYEPAKGHEKYILINISEQWLGAYENGKLKFSMPAATGKASTKTPNGVFQVSARHQNHSSSLYQTDAGDEQYPMDNAVRFHIDENSVAYWIHARDLPGRPASHGCVGLFDEAMQNRVYGFPDKPVLLDSEKLYDWAVGEDEYEDDLGEQEELEEGPVVEIIGDNPVYQQFPVKNQSTP